MQDTKLNIKFSNIRGNSTSLQTPKTKKKRLTFFCQKEKQYFCRSQTKKIHYFFFPFIHEISNQQTQKYKHYAKYQNINIFNTKVTKTISFYKDYAKKLPELRKYQTHSWCQIIILRKTHNTELRCN